MLVRGCCPGSRADRLLPGREATGTPVCRDCAGITRDFFCDRCGFEGFLLGGRLCERCTLANTLGRLLDDGTGHVATSLQPLVTSLLEMDRPKSRLIWLRNPNVVRLLRGLAAGSIPLTHDGLHQETPWRTVVHLRDLLMDSGVLPRVDRRILLYQRWLAERLATVQQADLDAWHTEKPATRRPAQTFLRWCMKTSRMPRLALSTMGPPSPSDWETRPPHFRSPSPASCGHTSSPADTCPTPAAEAHGGSSPDASPASR
ncbi:hypothetical protein [Streptomyces pactum]|nr:hypothetical protein [Streptomyces pactum]